MVYSWVDHIMPEFFGMIHLHQSIIKVGVLLLSLSSFIIIINRLITNQVMIIIMVHDLTIIDNTING